jgi:hypothetical protein
MCGEVIVQCTVLLHGGTSTASSRYSLVIMDSIRRSALKMESYGIMTGDSQDMLSLLRWVFVLYSLVRVITIIKDGKFDDMNNLINVHFLIFVKKRLFVKFLTSIKLNGLIDKFGTTVVFATGHWTRRKQCKLYNTGLNLICSNCLGKVHFLLHYILYNSVYVRFGRIWNNRTQNETLKYFTFARNIYQPINIRRKRGKMTLCNVYFVEYL